MRAGSRGQGRLRAAGIVAEVALALVLTSGTATMVGSLVQLQRVELGYRPDSVFIARLALPPASYARPADLSRHYQRLHDAIVSQPGVLAAGVTSIAPLSGLLAAINYSVAGEPTLLSERPLANYRTVSPGFFTAIRATISLGRDFATTDDALAIPVAIVSRALAERHVPGDPIGRQLLVDDNNVGPRPVTIVGVIDNLRHVTLDGEPTHDVFIPLAQVHSDGVSFVANNLFWTIRLAGEPTQFQQPFLRVLRQIDRDVATSGMGTMQDYVAAALAPRRFTVGLLVSLATVALVLAGVGG
jgi:hypothetical protein